MTVAPVIHPEWNTVLSKVQEYFPGAKIAGGCLRDSLLGHPVKDVDIFIPVDALFTKEDVPFELSADLGLALVSESVYGQKANDLDSRDVMCVFRYAGEYTYDFVFASPTDCDIRTFDLSVCQIDYDGKTVGVSDDFMESLQTRKVYVMNVNRADRQAARMERILSKLTDFTSGGERRPHALVRPPAA